MAIAAKKRGKPRGKPFQKGQSGNPNGRPKGAKNKATRAWKEFVQLVSEDEECQQTAIDAIKGGKVEYLFKAAEHAVGKPTYRVELTGELKMFQWPDSEDISEE